MNLLDTPKEILGYNVFEPGRTRQSDIVQAVIRLAILAVILILYGAHIDIVGRYMDRAGMMHGMLPLHAAVAIITVNMTMAIAALLAAIKAGPGLRNALRIIMPVIDLATMTALMLIGGEIMQPLFAVMVWLMIGTALRFGRLLLTWSLLLVVVSLMVIGHLDQYSQVTRMDVITMLTLTLIIAAYLYLVLEMVRRGKLAQRARVRERGQFVAMMGDTLLPSLERITTAANALAQVGVSPQDAIHSRRIADEAQAVVVMVKELFRAGILDDPSGGSGSGQEFHVRTCLNAVVRLLSDIAGERDVRLMASVDEGAKWLLRGDSMTFSQALLNLLMSSILQAPSGSTVSIWIRSEGEPVGGQTPVHVELRSRVDVGLLRGGNVETEMQHRHIGASLILQLGGSYQRKLIKRDVLLQLAVVPFGLVGHQDGWTLLEGERDPDADDPAMLSTAEQVAIGASSQVKVLVVEDQRSNRILLQSILCRAGYQACICADIERAIRHLERTRFDVIVVAVNLQSGSGLELVEHVHGRSKSGETAPPIIYLASEQDNTELPDITEHGHTILIRKPIVADEIVAAIQGVIQLPQSAPQ